MRSPVLRRVAPVVDAACLALFVLLGRESHGLGAGASWFVEVVWPFLAGWFAVALAVRLYANASRPWLRLAITWVAGIGLGLGLRVALTDRTVVGAFPVVVYSFTALFTFGWRAVVVGVRRATERTTARTTRA
jgi:Protein of unknown function (DUF3054)